MRVVAFFAVAAGALAAALRAGALAGVALLAVAFAAVALRGVDVRDAAPLDRPVDFVAAALDGADAFVVAALVPDAFLAAEVLRPEGAAALLAGAFLVVVFVFRNVLRTELGLNFIAVEALTFTVAPVRGLRAGRAGRAAGENLPKPGHPTVPPPFASDLTVSKKALITPSASAFDTPASLATVSTSSDLFTRTSCRGTPARREHRQWNRSALQKASIPVAVQGLPVGRAHQTVAVQRSCMLPDGTYDAFVLDAHPVDGDRAGLVRVEITITGGTSKGAVLVVLGDVGGEEAIDLLGLPATLVVAGGEPRLVLGDPPGMATARPRVGAGLSPAQRRAMSDTSNETGTAAAGGEPQHVPVNVYEAERALVIVAPLPGVMADDVSVVVEGRSATISAAMRTTAEKDYLVHEWHYGPYERTVDLPDGFGGTAEASFANGQLALRIERGDGGDRQTVTVNATRG